jgi:hypothetical protein
MGWDEIKAWMNNAARAAAGVVSPPAHSPGAVGIAGIRSMLPGSRSFDQELEAYNRDAAPSPLYSPTSRFGSVVTDPSKPLEPSGGERERQMQMAMQMPVMGPTAYHGSPHVFDKFSMSKIGTGEGAQAYGHGLYFTSEPKVADQYRRQLSVRDGKRPGVYIGGEHIDDYRSRRGITSHSVADDVLSDLRDATRSSDAPHEVVRDRYKANLEIQKDPWVLEQMNRRLKMLDEIEAGGISLSQPGSFHKVDIPDDLLDWERPLSEQPPPIREALASAGLLPTRPKPIKNRHNVTGFPSRDEAHAAAADHMMSPSDYVVEEVRPGMFQAIPKTDPLAVTGDRIYKDLQKELGPEAAAQKLREAGIPGHSYVGGSSGVRNFVMYDDAPIKPLGRWSSLEEFLRSEGASP